MPRVQAYGNRKVQTAPLPTVRDPRRPSPEEYGAGLGRVAAQVGGDWADQRQKQRDEIAYRDAANQLAGFIRTRREDPKTGWESALGVNAEGLPGQVQKELDEELARIMPTLSPRVSQAFQAHADDRVNAALEWAHGHAGDQLRAHDRQEGEKFIENVIVNGIAEAKSLDKVVIARDQIIAATVDLVRRQGGGPEMERAFIQSAVSKLHEGVIHKHIVAGDDQLAAQHYAMFKGEISGTAQVELEARLESATTAGKALRISEAIWSEQGPKSDSAAINLDQMEDRARTLLADQPKVLEQVLQNLQSKKSVADASRASRKAANVGDLWLAVAEGATLEQLRKHPNWTLIDGETQARLADYILSAAERRANRAAAIANRAFTEESHARSRRQWEEEEVEKRGFAMMWQYNRPEILSQMEVGDILNLTDSLGQTNVNRLLTTKSNLSKSEDNVRAATVDDQLFRTLADQAGLRPFASNLDDDEKARLGRLQDAVERQIDLEQQAKGRALNRSEKEAIMTALIDDTVLLSYTMQSDPRMPAAVVHPDDVTRAYVPLNEIPPLQIDRFVAQVRKMSPAIAALSDKDLRGRFGERFERAYAAVLMRLGDAEVIKRLEGR